MSNWEYCFPVFADNRTNLRCIQNRFDWLITMVANTTFFERVGELRDTGLPKTAHSGKGPANNGKADCTVFYSGRPTSPHPPTLRAVPYSMPALTHHSANMPGKTPAYLLRVRGRRNPAQRLAKSALLLTHFILLPGRAGGGRVHHPGRRRAGRGHTGRARVPPGRSHPSGPGRADRPGAVTDHAPVSTA